MNLSQKLLDSRDLPEIFKEICLQKLTGVFFAERLKYKRSVYFQNGAPIFAASNLSEDKIGKILFTRGKINMDQLMQALDRAKTEKKRLGSVLVELGHISAKDLFEAVVFQVEQILYSLFEQDWRDARFSFEANAVFGEEVIKLSIHPADVILEGIRRSYNPDLISVNVGEGNTIYAPAASKRSFEIEKLKINPEEKKAFILLDGRATIDQVVQESGAPKYKVQTLFYALKVLEIIQVRQTRVEKAQPAPAVAPAPAKGVASKPAPKLLEMAHPDGDHEDELEEMLPDEVVEELELGDVDLPSDMFSMESPEVKTTAQATEKKVTVATPAIKPKATGPIAPASKVLTGEELKAQAVRLRQLNFYQRLGVENNALPSVVIAAYQTLRKRYDSELPVTLKTAGKAPLALVIDAYKALAIEGNRRAYDEILALGGSPQEIETKYRLRMASTRFEEGKRAWDDKRLDEAESAFRESIETDPTKADYYFGLGLVLAAIEKGAPAYEEVEALFTKAAALQSDHPRGYYYLGTLLRMRGETEKATQAFRRALTLDSRYEPAREGLAACGQTA